MRYFLLVFALVFGCQEMADRQVPQIPVTAGSKASADGETRPAAFTTDLPQGISKVTSVEISVRGTATEYKYAFSEIGADCSAVSYGDFHSIDAKLKIDDLGADGIKTVCIVGRSSDGQEQQQPQLYQWVKITTADGVALPPAPVVTVKGMWLEYHDNTIELEVEAENGATHYQFAYRWGEVDGILDCEADFEEEHYSVEKEVAGNRTFTLDIPYNGYYTLCLRGKNSDAIQDNVSQYRFKKIDPPPPESAGMLEITTSHQPTSIHLFSTFKGDLKIMLSNKGTSNLDWKIEAEDEAKAGWLKIGTDSNDLRVVDAANNPVGGTVLAGEDVSVSLRLADVYKTDYAAGIKTAKLKVYNVSGEDDPVTISVHLYIPRVELIPDDSAGMAEISLSRFNKTEKIMLHNSATKSGWPVRSQLIPLRVDAEFTQVVNVRRDRDDSQTSFIEASINEAALLAKEDDYKGWMIYLLITNTSSQGASSTCGESSPGVVGGIPIMINSSAFTPEYTTNICRIVYVAVKK